MTTELDCTGRRQPREIVLDVSDMLDVCCDGTGRPATKLLLPDDLHRYE